MRVLNVGSISTSRIQSCFGGPLRTDVKVKTMSIILPTLSSTAQESRNMRIHRPHTIPPFGQKLFRPSVLGIKIVQSKCCCDPRTRESAPPKQHTSSGTPKSRPTAVRTARESRAVHRRQLQHCPRVYVGGAISWNQLTAHPIR
jgi:hypothetical protein